MNRKFVISFLAIVVVAAGLFVPFPFKQAPIPVRVFLDMLHLPLFVAFPLWLAWITPSASIQAIAVRTICVIVAIEAIQPLTGRSAELHDFLYGLLGLAFALVFLHSKALDTERQRALVLTFFLLFLCLFGLPVISPTSAYIGYRQNFPVLSDFSKPWYSYLWVSGLDGSNRLNCKIVYPDPQTSEFQCVATESDLNTIQFTPGLMNWSDYSRLLINIKNPGDPFTLHFRIDDSNLCNEYSCRFQQSKQIEAGDNTISIAFRSPLPNNEHLKPEHILRLILFTFDDVAGRKFVLKKIWLE